MPSIEKLMYEVRPYIYIALGVIGMRLQNNSIAGIVCGLILFGCAIYVIRERLNHRNQMALVAKLQANYKKR